MISRHITNGFTPVAEEDQVIISGLAGTYPSAYNAKEFMKKLMDMEDCCTFNDKITHPEIPPITGRIPDPGQFDNSFFEVNKKRTKCMDAMQRIMLEKAYEAILDAGLNPDDIKGSNTGVFVGSCTSETSPIHFRQMSKDCYIPLGNLGNMIANHVSFALGVNGPSYNCDTACSSSMYAFEEGYRAIIEGRCDTAIICGANLTRHEGVMLQFSFLGVLNQGAGCRPFDDKATGYTRSEAIVAVVLQKLKNANRIYAKVIHSKTNSDGHKEMGITFPSSECQEVLLQEVFKEANVDPASIAFVEAHGTGTPAGDPEELRAMDSFFKPTIENPLLIGSVKGNVGHSEPSSGLCSVTKLVYMLNFDTFIPNIHYDTPRKEIDALVEGRMEVVTKAKKLPDDARLFTINCFGFGGANGNIILEKFEKVAEKIQYDFPRLVCFSGRTLEAVRHFQEELKSKYDDPSCIRLVHQIFRKPIRQHSYRSYMIFGERDHCIVNRFCPNVAGHPLGLLVGTCNEYPVNTVNEFLRVPSLEITYKKIKTICENNKIKVSLKGDSDIPNYLILQLGLVDLLSKDLKLTFNFVHGVGNFGKLVAAYAKQEISLQQLVLSAVKVGKNQANSKEENRKLQAIKKKSCFLVNLDCDSDCHGLRLMSPQGNVGTLVKGIGQLYLEGFNPHLANLYSDISLPVGRGASLISPLIKWKQCDHDYIYEVCRPRHKLESLEMGISRLQYYQGHVIDERLLFPATGYLYHLWVMFSESQMKSIFDTCVVFEHVKFHKATHFEPNTLVHLCIVLNADGLFEITAKDSVVVTGYIRNAKQLERCERYNRQVDVEGQELLLSTKDVYKELRLRGYNYRGKFKGIHLVSPEAALIKWEENWVTFLDNMLQLAILQKDSRNLYVPVGIERLYIDCTSHTKEMKSLPDPKNVTVLCAPDSRSFGSKYVEVRGIQARAIQKKRDRLEPILESNRFVPNECECSLIESIRINLQILLECHPTSSFKAAELLPEDFKVESQDAEINGNIECIAPFICNAAADLPLISPDLTIVSKLADLEVDNVTIVQSLTRENTLFVAHSTSAINDAFNSTISNGFVLCISSDDAFEDPRFQLLTKHKISKEDYVYFLRKKTKADDTDREFINVSKLGDIKKWLEEVQKAMVTKNEVILVSEQVEQSGILGFVNCLRREPGCTKARCVFLMDTDKKFDAKDAFIERQLEKGLPINILKGNKWGTYRHLLLSNLSEIPCDHVYANVEKFGDLSSLNWRQGPIAKSTPCTKVAFSALNFRDLMLAYGKITPDSITSDRFMQNFTQGLEFSGTNCQGEKVIGISKGAIGNVVKDSDLEIKVPQGWTLEEAATVLVVYSTSLLALKNKANISKGQSILIHSGCGGVGLAAINICIYFECNIFVTVGTEEKKEYLIENYPNLKASHIGHSRDKSFKQMVLKETHGRGVDIVLNSLAEDKLKTSVECLADGGIFLEIGKFDLEMNNYLPLDFLNRECTYAGVMLDRSLSNTESQDKDALFGDILLQGVKEGYVKPLPRTIFGMDELEKAFRYMSSGKHIGKVLIKIHQEADKLPGLPRYYCDPMKSYVVFGGLGGFGLELCDWLVMRGARNLVISSRSGVQSGYQKYRIAIWESYGVKVAVNTEDALTEDGCRKILTEATNLGAVVGIFNLAVVLKDAILENQTSDTMLVSYGPKALLTQHLDKLSRQMCPELDKFVVFSSVSCGRGNAGQTNYGYSNSVMERICEIRHREGLPAIAIQWGAVGDVGLLEDIQRENNQIAIGGTLQQKIANCLEVFDKLIQQPDAVVSSMIVAEKFGHGGSDNPVEAVAKILGLKNIKAVNKHAPLTELGMDSMLGAEIKQTLERDFDIILTPNEIRTLTFSKLEDIASGELTPGGSEVDRELALNMIVPTMQLAEGNEEILVINESAPNYIFGFPGIEGTATSLSALAKFSNMQIKIPHYNIIGEDAEGTIDRFANVLYQAFKEEVSRNGTFRLVSHSYGCLSALKLASEFELKLGVSGIIVFIDGAPMFMSKILEVLAVKNEADFQSHLLEFIISKWLPKEVSKKIKDVKKHIQDLETFDDRLKFLQEDYKPLYNELSDKDKHDLNLLSNGLYKRIQSVQNFKETSLEPRLKSKVFLYRPKTDGIPFVSDDYDLSKWCRKVTVKKFDGNHQTILENEEMFRSFKTDIDL